MSEQPDKPDGKRPVDRIGEGGAPVKIILSSLLAIGAVVLPFALVAGGAFIGYWTSVVLFYPFPASLGIWTVPVIWAIGGAFIGYLSIFILSRRPAWGWLVLTIFGSAGILCLAWVISQFIVKFRAS